MAHATAFVTERKQIFCDDFEDVQSGLVAVHAEFYLYYLIIGVQY